MITSVHAPVLAIPDTSIGNVWKDGSLPSSSMFSTEITKEIRWSSMCIARSVSSEWKLSFLSLINVPITMNLSKI